MLSAAPAHAELTASEPQPVRRADPDAAAAPPELALGNAQLVLAPRRDLLDDDAPDPYLRYAGFAQLTGGGSARGDLGAGVAAAVSGIGCDVVAGSAQGRLRPTAELRAVGEAWWSVCLSRIGLTVAFDGHDGLGLAPSIAARRSLWSRRYDEHYRSMTLALGEAWLSGSPNRHAVFVFTLGHGTTSQRDGMDRRRIVEIDGDFAIYRYHRVGDDRELVVDAVVVTDDSIKAGDSNLGGVSYAILPARIKLVTGDAYVTAQAGIGHTGGSTMASSAATINGQPISAWADQIDGTGLPALRTLVGAVTAGVTRGSFDAAGSLSRGFYPTFDGNVALDNRLVGSATWIERGRHPRSLTVSPFIAHTTTWLRAAGTTREVGFGASLHAAYALDELVNLEAIGEAGRTPYARLDGARLADAYGGQLIVALSARVAR